MSQKTNITGNIEPAAALTTTPTMGSKATDVAKTTIEKGKDTISKYVGNKGPIIILIAIITLAFIAIIIWITFSMRASNLKGKQLLRKPVKLDELNVSMTIDAGDIPKPVVGREYTYSFWMYVDSFNQTDGVPKMIFYRGATKNSITDANPIVMMDGKNNSLYFVLRTQGSNLVNTSSLNYDTTPQNILDRSYFLNSTFTAATPNTHMHMIMSIDYIPLQRWVHTVMVVDNKMVTIFIDGEIYSVKTTDEYKMTKGVEYDIRGNKVDRNLIIEKTEGSLHVGKFGPAVPPGSYLSNLEFYNYAISINDVKKIYMGGPFSKNFLSMIGVSSYGVRSPIYKVDEYQSKN
jgi:hypothetical protein